jgi:hypothetical protein
MKKIEIKKLNTVKALFMADVKKLSSKKDYREGYKAGFNTCRRRIRKLLGVLVTNKNP